MLVRNSYDERDLLRAAGFRWVAERKAWGMPEEELRARLGCEEITAELLLRSLEGLGERAAGEKEASVVVQGGEVLVTSSYHIKEELRMLGFRWDADRCVWCAELGRLLARCRAEDAGELTVERLLEAAEDPAPPVGGTPAAPRGAAWAEVEKGEVCVYSSYEIKDELRARGFRCGLHRCSVWRAPATRFPAAASRQARDRVEGDSSPVICLTSVLECAWACAPARPFGALSCACPRPEYRPVAQVQRRQEGLVHASRRCLVMGGLPQPAKRHRRSHPQAPTPTRGGIAGSPPGVIAGHGGAAQGALEPTPSLYR